MPGKRDPALVEGDFQELDDVGFEVSAGKRFLERVQDVGEVRSPPAAGRIRPESRSAP